MNLTINLATRRYINVRQLNTMLAVAFVVLAALLIFKVRSLANNQAEINRIKAESAAASRGTKGGPTVTPEQMKALDAKIAFANSLIDQKTLNWVVLLDKLELVVPAGVALTQVSPGIKDQTLKFTGVALSFDRLRNLLENMEQSPNFSEVYLLSQAEQKVGKTQQGLGFSISCKVSYR